MGAVPHRCAQAASDRSWPGLSPAVTSKAAAADPHAVQCQQVRGGLGHQLGQQGIEVRLSPHPGPAPGARGSAGRSWWRR